MNIFSPTKTEFLCFLLILFRVSGIFVAAPILSSRNIPPKAKIGLAFFTSLILFPFIKAPGIPENLMEYVPLIGKELFVGLTIGYIATLIFIGILVATKIIDFQMGFGIANVIDPVTNIQVSIVGEFHYILALMFFLVINGHHLLFSALAQSFNVVPLATFEISAHLIANINQLFAEVFVIALKIGAPTIGALFMASLILGVIARTMPQINVFIVGMPLKIGIGFAMLIVTMPFFFILLHRMIQKMPLNILNAIR
ncbi:MAG TPA: flagellar type III secretion system protein FliR [Actinobacteria bacterium]|nr:flagellar type III secretion system protein FliR [Actinomycetota bacterium]